MTLEQLSKSRKPWPWREGCYAALLRCECKPPYHPLSVHAILYRVAYFNCNRSIETEDMREFRKFRLECTRWQGAQNANQ